MSKLLNWFKKDKPTNNPEQDNNIPPSLPEVENTEQLESIANDEQSFLEEVVTAPTKMEEQSDKKVNVQELDDETLSNKPSDFSTAPIVVEALDKEQADIKEPMSTVETEPTSVSCEPPIIEQIPEVGMLARLKASLSRTKANIGSGFTSLLMGKTIDEDLYEELETQLLLADVGMTTTNKIIDELVKNAKNSQLKDGEALSGMLQAQMQIILDKVDTPLNFDIAIDESGKKHPFVILMVGVNGVGKTTTIGKLAKQFQAQGKSVMLAAGDTFRAAAVEQLQVWGERNDIQVVAQHTGADSASVIFDAIESAKAKNADVLIADTAGRLQNKEHLIEELKKVVRVMKKLNPQAPHEVMLTLDASTGQNAISQTRIFNQAVGITGINLTKLDGSAKGGVIFALANEFSIPVRYIGIGEGIDDLRQFDSKTFVEALFSQ